LGEENGNCTGHRRQPRHWKATALQLAREGYTVAVNYHHNIKAATDVINQIVEAGGKAFAVRADISDEAQVLAMFDSLDREGEPLTALVNNAGILFEQSTIENLSAERINRVLATNVTGYFLCCREAVKRMSFKHGGKGGAIVNVSSAASRLGRRVNMWITPRPKGRWIR
jgi:NAD(P)-dependent dehydrogenase (short-subunit alcohol dehydrogenase family)